MASIGDRSQDRDQSSVRDEKGNPFVTFSRLVDQQISSFFHTLTSFPSSSKPQSSNLFSSNLTEEQQSAREEDEAFNKWVKEETEKFHKESTARLKERFRRETQDKANPYSSPPSDFTEQQLLSKEEEQEYQHWFQDGADEMARKARASNIQRWRRETQQDGRAPYAQPSSQPISQGQPRKPTDDEHGEAGSILELLHDAVSEGRLKIVDNVKREDSQLRCPYQPAYDEEEDDDDDEEDDDDDDPEESRVRGVRLMVPRWCRPFIRVVPEDCLTDDPEDRHPFREYTTRWRKAFEDLLRIQHGLEPSGTYLQDGEEDKGEWVDSLHKQGLIDRSPFCRLRDLHESPATRQPENDAEEDAPTELDLYERFLGARAPHFTTNASAQTFSSNTGSQSAPNQTDLISTMTTTQRHTLPDGSVYTKIVLKRGFSDGREETTETEHTTHGLPSLNARKQIQQQPKETIKASLPALGYDGKVKQAIEEKKKGGWFWS
ncbi:MAG: hypothetical protein Q9181_001098 [Wetmoreana brouardii]